MPGWSLLFSKEAERATLLPQPTVRCMFHPSLAHLGLGLALSWHHWSPPYIQSPASPGWSHHLQPEAQPEPARLLCLQFHYRSASPPHAVAASRSFHFNQLYVSLGMISCVGAGQSILQDWRRARRGAGWGLRTRARGGGQRGSGEQAGRGRLASLTSGRQLLEARDWYRFFPVLLPILQLDCHCFSLREAGMKRIAPGWRLFFKPLILRVGSPGTQRPTCTGKTQMPWLGHQAEVCCVQSRVHTECVCPCSSPPMGCPGARQTEGMVNVEACLPRLTRLMGEHTAAHTLSPRHSPQGSQAVGGCAQWLSWLFHQQGFSRAPPLSSALAAPGMLTALAMALRDPEREWAGSP